MGTLEPRKNLVRLVAAFERLAVTDLDLRLALAGAPGWHSSGLLDAIRRSPVADRIVLPGYLAAPDLAALVAGAAVLAYVSLYEGYGLPVVEAMRLGVLVVTSAVSSMPEAAGGAAVLVDPLDPDAIAAGIRRALAERVRLVAAGSVRAGRTWRDVAAETIDVYDWVIRSA